MLYECHFMLKSGFTLIKEIEFDDKPPSTRIFRQCPRLDMVDLSKPTAEISHDSKFIDIRFHLEHVFRAHHKQIAYYLET